MSSISTHPIQRFRTGRPAQALDDSIIVESPLEIVIGYTAQGKRHKVPIAATMRTPGDDFNLVAGWLFTEGVVQSEADLIQVKYLGNTDTVLAELAPSVVFNPEENQRRFPISSACGWCGRDANAGETPNILPHSLQVSSDLIMRLPEVLREGQGLFSATGGAHAIALVDAKGELVLRCEDVGRHNAMDKLLGAMLRNGQLPLHRHIAVFSGRLGYELAQKSLAGGIQILCSIGAPSSAALELAEAYGMTVCGFVRPDGFNLYCGAERIIAHETSL
jgi:FdhD protein